MLAANIPDRFPIPFAKNAGPSYIRPIPTPSQIGIQNGAASLNDGFPPLNFIPEGAGGVPPFGEDMNGLLFRMTSWEQWFAAGAPVGYDSTFSAAIGGYPEGAILAAAVLGNFWISTVDNNLSNPDTGGANWVGFTPVNLYANDVGTANAGVISLLPAPVSLPWLTGRPIRVKKVSFSNTGAYTLDVGFGPIAVVHTDSSPLTNGELPASGIYTVIYDGAQFQAQGLQNLVTSEFTIKGSAIFHWNGSAVVITQQSSTIASITRIATGKFQITMTGGLNFAAGFAMANGYISGGGSRGLIGMGSSFSGVNPTFDVYFNDAGSTGGTDPTSDVGVLIFGQLN